MRKLFLTAATLVPLVMPALSQADNSARDYLPAPPGTGLMLFYDAHISAHKFYANGDKILDNINVSGDVYIFRPVYYMSYFGLLNGAQQVLFFMKDLDFGSDTRVSGMGDMLYSPAFFLWNNPAQKSYLGFISHITVPIGEYDEDNPGRSAGGHVWRIRPELNFTQGIGDKLYLEISGNAEFSQTNKDFGKDELDNDLELEKDPFYTVEAHASYTVATSLTLAADYYWHGGGKTTINRDRGGDIENDDGANTHSVGASIFYGIAPSNQLMASYLYDVEVKNGAKIQQILLRFLQVF